MPLTIVVISLFIEIIKDQVQNVNKTGVAAAMIREDNTDAFKVKLQNCKLRIMVIEGMGQTMSRRLEKQVVPIAINNEVHSVTEW